MREGVLKNAYLYQGSFSEEDEELGWNEFALRNYDPQVGRWIQQDPYQQFASPYTGMGNDPVNGMDPSGGIYIPPFRSALAVAGAAGQTASIATSSMKTFQVISAVSSILVSAGKVAEAINTSYGTGGVGDNLSYESLSNNPDFYGLGLGELRGMVKGYDRNLEQWQINISAGLLLEDLYANFSGLRKNTSHRIVGWPNPNGVFPLFRRIIPDFMPGSNVLGEAFYPDGGVVEVKAVNDPISLSTSNFQVSAEISIAGRAIAIKEGVPDEASPNAGQRRVAGVVFVLPADRSIDKALITAATERGVNILVSYAFINIKTRRIVFSSPKNLNNVGNIHPYAIKGTINGITPDLKKAIQRWRINEKRDIDDGDN